MPSNTNTFLGVGLPQPRSGADLVARALKAQGVEVVFGIVGIPVVEVAASLTSHKIRFIAFRNEQSASYAASAYGYITGRPGVCLVVGGPGVVHAMAGMTNSEVNRWPMLLIAGASETDGGGQGKMSGKGAFQEMDQVALVGPHVKFAARAPSIEQVPATIAKAYRYAFHGKPGASYFDLPADHIQYALSPSTSSLQIDALDGMQAVRDAPRSVAHPAEVAKAVKMLKDAKRPLIVVGKGAQYAQADTALSRLLELLPVPFLPTPMGKGLVPDTHPLCVAAARSLALSKADVVLLLGARLNWILHFGDAPRWGSRPRWIRVDKVEEEVHENHIADVALVGDLREVTLQMADEIERHHLPRGKGCLPEPNLWVAELRDKVRSASASLRKLAQPPPAPRPLTYHSALFALKALLPADHVLVSEGANTMDIARSILDVHRPRSRLDAATFATMGVGMGFAIAAAIAYPSRKVVMVEGDSAFGFSAPELETAARNKLGLLIVVLNNGGVYHGLDAAEYANTPPEQLPATALMPEVRYDQMCEACGGRGFLVRTVDALNEAMRQGLRENEKPTVINVLIEPGGKKKLEFGWQNKEKKVAKL